MTGEMCFNFKIIIKRLSCVTGNEKGVKAGPGRRGPEREAEGPGKRGPVSGVATFQIRILDALDFHDFPIPGYLIQFLFFLSNFRENENENLIAICGAFTFLHFSQIFPAFF